MYHAIQTHDLSSANHYLRSSIDGYVIIPIPGSTAHKKKIPLHIFVGVIVLRRLRQAGLGVRSVRTRPTDTPLLCEVIYDGRRLR